MSQKKVDFVTQQGFLITGMRVYMATIKKKWDRKRRGGRPMTEGIGLGAGHCHGVAMC